MMFARKQHLRLIGVALLSAVSMIGMTLLNAGAARAASITASPVTLANALNGTDGTCSLAEAVIAANTNSNSHEPACAAGAPLPTIDIINVLPGTHYAVDPNVNAQTALFITEGVIIQGNSINPPTIAPGADDISTTSDGLFTNQNNHAFFILSDDITIRDVIIDGKANTALGTDIEFRTGIVSNPLALDRITIEDVTIRNVKRRAVNIAAGFDVVVQRVTAEIVETGFAGVGIAVFAAEPNADPVISNSTVSDFGSGIGVNRLGAANSGVYTIADNTISSLQPITLPAVNFSYGILVSGAADGAVVTDNTITLTNDGALDVGIYALQNLNNTPSAARTLTIDGNTITTAGADIGILLYQNALASAPAFTQTVSIVNNAIIGSSPVSSGLSSTGVFIGDESQSVTGFAGVHPAYAVLTGNTISGYQRGVYVRRSGASGGQSVEARLNGNRITDNVIGLEVEGSPSGPNAFVTSTTNAGLFARNGIGIEVGLNGNVSLGANCVVENTSFGARSAAGGTLTLINGWWGSSAGPNTALADATSGTMTTAPFASAPIIVGTAVCQSTFGDQVWNDANGNGVQDAGEPDAAGVLVNVYDSSGTTLLGGVTTNANGNYRVGRPAGTYVLEVPGLPLTIQGAGGDPALDSDFSQTTNRTTVTLPTAAVNDNVDAGLLTAIQIDRTSAPGLTIADAQTIAAEGATVGDQFAVRLGAAPSANVTITAAADAAQLRVSASSAPASLQTSINLVFTPANWNVWQIVNVSALADSIAEGAHTANITLAVAAGSAPEFLSVPAVIETVDIREPGVLFAPTNPLMQEGGSTTASVQLSAPPGLQTVGGGLEIVTVTPLGHNVRFLNLTPTAMQFTRANWNIPQTLNAFAPDDPIDRGNRYSTMLFYQTTTNVLSPLDSFYGGAPTVIAFPRQRFTIQDNDLVAVSMSDDEYEALNQAAWLEVGVIQPVMAGGSAQALWVRLNGQPAEGDTVTVMLSTAPGLTLTPNMLMFTTHNWDVPQLVTVSALPSLAGQTLPVQITAAIGRGETAQSMIGAAQVVEMTIVSSLPPMLPPAELPPMPAAPEGETGTSEGSVVEQ
jgi:hypothetical protein